MEVLIAKGYDSEVGGLVETNAHLIERNVSVFSGGKGKPILQYLKDKYNEVEFVDYEFKVLNRFEIQNEPMSTFKDMPMRDFKKILNNC